MKAWGHWRNVSIRLSLWSYVVVYGTAVRGEEWRGQRSRHRINVTQRCFSVSLVSGVCCCCHSVFGGAAGRGLRWFLLSAHRGNKRTHTVCYEETRGLHCMSYRGQLMSGLVCNGRGEQCFARDSRHTQHKSELREHLERMLPHDLTSSRGHTSK